MKMLIIKDLQELPQSLQRFCLKNADKIESVSNDEGYWLYLRPGFCSDQDTHSVHEDTVAKVKSAFAAIRTCDCEDCLYILNGGE